MSDSDFDDDDNEMLLQLARASQRPAHTLPIIPQRLSECLPQSLSENSNNSQNQNIQKQLYNARGEISILRAQLESIQKQKAEETARLEKEAQNAHVSVQEHISLLKQTVDKLEDEKKFLGNEIRALSLVKRRRVGESNSRGLNNDIQHRRANENSSVLATESTQKPSPFPRMHLQDDWSQLCHSLWTYTINGSRRTSMDFLAKIGVDAPVLINENLSIPRNTSIMSCFWDMLINFTYLRLDQLVQKTCESILALISELLRLHENKVRGVLTSVPFLISLIHACINFKPSAVSESLIKVLIDGFCRISQKFVFVLHLNNEEEEAFSDQSMVTYQQLLIENFILLSAFDVLESSAVIATQYGAEFCRSLWHLEIFEVALMQQILPENTERFVSSVQINLVSSFVEILSASLNEHYFCSSNGRLNLSLVKSLLKVFIIDIAMKKDFMFYGLNRVLGNNADFNKLNQAIPSDPDQFCKKSLVSIPHPIKSKELNVREKFHLVFQHDIHLLTLRVRIVTLLEAIAVSDKINLLNSKENIKSIVRIIGYEQNHLIHQPRYELNHMRLTIIGVLVRILYYIIEEHKSINTLIFPETLYEIFVVLMRIAFASDSLTFEAQELLSRVRANGAVDIGVFNKSCELRKREMAHFDLYSSQNNKLTDLARLEGDFANGLEFPYESDTIEVAREILSVCVNHDEADNLYYNMHQETQQ